MTDAPTEAWRTPVPQPMWRVARDPEALPRIEPGQPPKHRYDDPLQQYTVRYLAETLTACLFETMQPFRPPHPDVERRLTAVSGLSPHDHEPDRTVGLLNWLDNQQIGQARATEPADRLIIVLNAVDRLDAIPRVQAALRAHDPEAHHLDASHILAAGTRGRAITQALSRAVYELDERPAGLQYLSRHGISLTCYAVYDRTPMHFDEVTRLSRHNPDHQEVVQSVCRHYEIPIPPGW